MSNGSKKPRHWTPLRPASRPSIEPGESLAYAAKLWNVSETEAKARLDEYEAGCEYWLNDLYQVQVRHHDNAGLLHLNIRRRDGAIIRDWRHLQEIKNQLLGAECEAVELYPAESRKVDTSNKFHLWGYRDPTWRFPLGFDSRDVNYDHNFKAPGLKQRPL
jgi:hypothetical protein